MPRKRYRIYGTPQFRILIPEGSAPGIVPHPAEKDAAVLEVIDGSKGLDTILKPSGETSKH
jgi:hypothetical protein